MTRNKVFHHTLLCVVAVNQGAVVMQPGDSLMLGHSTLRLEDTFGETFTAPGAPFVLPSRTPLLDALRTVGAELGTAAAEKPLVKINSDHAQQIYLHPFTQLAIERGRQRRAALEGISEDGKDAFEAMAGIDTYRSTSGTDGLSEGLAEATGIDSARGPASSAATARGIAPAFSSSGTPVTLPPLRPPHAPLGGGGAASGGGAERKTGDEWTSSPRGPPEGRGGGGAASASGGVRGGASGGGAASSGAASGLLPGGLSDAGRLLLHAALE